MGTPVPPTPNPEFEQIKPGEPYQYANPQNRAERIINRLPAQSRRVNLPSGAPRFLADRATIFYAWAISMAVIGWDEWHNLGILPRPARLWDATLFYGILILFSSVDAVVPLANAFAVGYTIVLIWQYYQGGITPAASSPSTTTNNPNIAGTAAGSTAPNSNAGQVVIPVPNATNLFPIIGPGSNSNTSPQPTPTPGGG